MFGISSRTQMVIYGIGAALFFWLFYSPDAPTWHFIRAFFAICFVVCSAAAIQSAFHDIGSTVADLYTKKRKADAITPESETERAKQERAETEKDMPPQWYEYKKLEGYSFIVDGQGRAGIMTYKGELVLWQTAYDLIDRSDYIQVAPTSETGYGTKRDHENKLVDHFIKMRWAYCRDIDRNGNRNGPTKWYDKGRDAAMNWVLANGTIKAPELPGLNGEEA
jgi:hypothetical protein